MEHSTSWRDLIATNPGHSQWYIDRFRAMAAAGDDLGGEARMIDAMVPRGSRILDAGCGPGRVGAHLHAAGHDVVGVDLDAALIAAAEEDHPGPRWLVGDLSELDLPARGVPADFAAIVSAGNVLPFVEPERRRRVLERLRAHLAPKGRLVVGFGAGRGYDFSVFLDDAAHAGLTPDLLLSTWDLRPFTDSSMFLVAILRPAEAPRAA